MTLESGFRMTRQRQLILDELKKTSFHPTAYDVYELVRKRLPNISLGTVYRNLDVLAANGLVRILELGRGQRRFDADLHDHYHVRCENCDRVENVPFEPLERLEKSIRESTDYHITGYHLEFLGICPGCGAQKTTPRDSQGENTRGGTKDDKSEFGQ